MDFDDIRQAFNRLFGRGTEQSGGQSQRQSGGQSAPVNEAASQPANDSFVRPGDGGSGWYGLGMYPMIDGYPASQMVSLVDGVETVPAAACAVSIYADTLADLPKFVRRKESRNKRLPDHWLTELLNDPHPGINGPKLWRWVGREIAARGEACLAMKRVGGIPVEFRPARLLGRGGGQRVDRPGTTVWVQEPEGVFASGTVSMPYPSEDILHFTDTDYDPFLGHSVNPLTSRAKNPIGAFKQIWNRYTFRNSGGGHDNVFITLPESADEWDTFMERFERHAAGIRNAGKPFPLPYGSDAKALKLTDVERETLGMLNFLVIEIARAWGIPPFMIFARLGEGVSARARSDLAEQFLNWQRLRYASFVKNITEEINAKVLKPLALAGMATAKNVCVEFDLDHMTMGTFEGRSKIAVELHSGGILTKNEARGLVDFDPIEGGDELPQVRGGPPERNRGKGSSAPGDEPNDPDD